MSKFVIPGKVNYEKNIDCYDLPSAILLLNSLKENYNDLVQKLNQLIMVLGDIRE